MVDPRDPYGQEGGSHTPSASIATQQPPPSASQNHSTALQAPRLRASRSMATMQSYQPSLSGYSHLPGDPLLMYNPYRLPALPSVPSVYPSSSNQTSFPPPASNLLYSSLRPVSSDFANSSGSLGLEMPDSNPARYHSIPPPMLGYPAARTAGTVRSTPARQTLPSSAMPASASSAKFSIDSGSGHADTSSNTADEHLYVSPKLIMSDPAAAGPSSRQASVTPPTASTSAFYINSLAQPSSQPNNAFTSMMPSSAMPTGVYSTSSSPLTGRNPNVTLSPGFVFDPDWELPSPMMTTDASGRAIGYSSQYHRSNHSEQRGQLSHNALSSAASSNGVGQNPLSISSPNGASTFPARRVSDGDSVFRANEYMTSIPSVVPSSFTASTFRYSGYDAMPPSTAAGTEAFSASMSRASSMLLESRSTASSPRPSSEPVQGSSSRTRSWGPDATTFNSKSNNMGQNTLQLTSFGVPGPLLDIPMPSSNTHQASTSRRPSGVEVFPSAASGSRTRSSKRHGQLSRNGYPSMTPVTPYSSPSHFPSHGLPPLPELVSNRDLSPRRRHSSGYLNTVPLSAGYSSASVPLDDANLRSTQHRRPYGTRTRANMQGLMHKDHVDQGFPGEWADAFR